ncbi:MAG: glycosyltransferase [Candidatus Levyibacteriota bacterium]
MARLKKHKITTVSLIIPAYKQEKTIQKDIKQIKKTMSSIRFNYEIIVVVDGIIDNTFKNAQKLASQNIKIVGYKHNHGKGYAVRYGMANAKGNLIAFLDSGMDINPNGLSLILEDFTWRNADIIIGSKLHRLSKVKYPVQRKILSWGYRMITKSLFGLGVQDTQVGLKVFRRQVLEDVLPRLLVKRYAFDIEMLVVAYNLGYKRIFEAPIEITFSQWSSITSKNFLKLIILMLWDTLAVFYRLKILHYYSNENRRKWRYDPELNFRVNI